MQVLIIDLEIGIIFQGNVSSIKLPGIDGNFQILNNHANILSILKIGIIELYTLEQDKIIQIKIYNSGLLKVNNNIIKILLN